MTTTQLPSADLIVYRFDQTDKRVDAVFAKLDDLTHTFVTKEELREVTKRLDNWQWYLRALIVAALTALGTAIAAFFVRMHT